MMGFGISSIFWNVLFLTVEIVLWLPFPEMNERPGY